MFIVDFDDTLFNSFVFKKDRFEAAHQFGVPLELFLETYWQNRTNPDGTTSYTNERHAAALAAHGFPEDKIARAFAEITKPRALQKYLFPDTIAFLDFLKQTGKPVVLLSHGDPTSQELKVRGVGIHDAFDRVFFVDGPKAPTVGELLNEVRERPVWFINDKVGETQEIQKEFKELNIVLKQAEQFAEKEYQESGLPYFKTLQEIQKFLDKKE